MLSIDAWLDEKPYKEVYDGAIHPKVSSRSTHAIVAGELYAALRAWGSATGSTGVEWRVHLAPGITLVPDVAYFARGRLARLIAEDREKPPFAPDIAVEVRSPGDSDRHVKRKSRTLLAARRGARARRGSGNPHDRSAIRDWVPDVPGRRDRRTR